MNRRAVSQIAMVFAFVRRGCRHVCVYYTFDTVDYLVLLATVSLSLLRKTGKQSLSSKLPVQLAARSCKDAQAAEAEQRTRAFRPLGFPFYDHRIDPKPRLLGHRQQPHQHSYYRRVNALADHVPAHHSDLVRQMVVLLDARNGPLEIGNPQQAHAVGSLPHGTQHMEKEKDKIVKCAILKGVAGLLVPLRKFWYFHQFQEACTLF